MQHILIMGSGAVGGYYGAKFASADGLNVTFVARGEHLYALQRNGLRFTGKEDIWLKKIHAIANPREVSHPPDLIIIAVKSIDTRHIIEQIKPVVATQTQILSLQNGLENYDLLVDTFSSRNVIRGFCRIGVEITSPGVISFSGMSSVIFGEEDGLDSERVQQLRKLMENAGINYTASRNIRKDVWLKFMWNGVFNMITGLALVTTDGIFQDEDAYKTAWTLFFEMQAIAKAEGITITEQEGTDIIDKSKGFSAFRTSTFQDRLKGKPLEYDAFCGYIVRKADQYNIDVPATRTLFSLYKLMSDFQPEA